MEWFPITLIRFRLRLTIAVAAVLGAPLGWMCQAEEAAKLAVLEGWTSSVVSVAFSPDGATLAAAGEKGQIILWDVQTRQRRKELTASSGKIRAISFSPDGRFLASVGGDEIQLWNVSRSFSPTTAPSHDSKHVAFSPLATQLAVAGDELCVHQLEDGQLKPCLRSAEHTIVGLRFVTDDRLLLADSRGVLYAVNPNKAEFLADEYLTTGRWLVLSSSEKGSKLQMGRKSEIARAAFSPDGDKCALPAKDQGIELWDLSTRGKTHVLKGHKGPISSLRFSRDSKLLASGSGTRFRFGIGLNLAGFFSDNEYVKECQVRIWDAATGRELQCLEGHTGDVWSVDFDPNRKLLASGGEDKRVLLWDLARPADAADKEQE